MKKLLTLIVCLFSAGIFMQTKAQNVQLLYDAGRGCTA